jgi:hypothetical protein
MYKSAAEETWSLAPSLHLVYSIPTPYDTIIQYTSSMLREVSIASAFDYPTVLKHLRDHCPNLQRLRITSKLLMTFDRFDEVLGAILQRVKRFKVTHDELSDAADPTERLLQAISHFQTYPRINSVDLEWPTRNLTALKAVLAKLPSLEEFRMPLHREHIDFFELFSESVLLERIGGLYGEIDGWLEFCLSWIPAMSDTRIGLNLSMAPITNGKLDSRFGFDKDIPVLLIPTAEISFLDFLKEVSSAGLQQQLKPDLLLSFIAQSVRSGGVDELIAFMLSPNAPPFLPRPQELARLLRTSVITMWSFISRLSRPTLEAIFKSMGAPEISPLSLVGSALSRSEFDPSIMKLFSEINIEGVSDSHMSQSLQDAAENWFVLASTPGAVKWLLNTLSDEKIRKSMVQPVPDGGFFRAVLWYCSLDRMDLVDALVEHFGDDSNFLFSFPDETQFMDFALYCRSKTDLDHLKRAVVATGSDLISPSTRAYVLWYLWDNPIQNEDTRKMLNYWIDVIAEGSEPDFGSLFFNDDSEEGEPILSKLASRGRPLELLPILIRFKNAISKQLPHMNVIPLLTHLHQRCASGLEAYYGEPAFDDTFSYFEKLFEDVVRLCISAGISPTAQLLPYCYGSDEITPSNYESTLFDLAHRVEFSSDNQHKAFSAWSIMDYTIQLWEGDAPAKTIATVLALWIDHVTKESFTFRGRRVSIMDVVLQENVATLIPDLEGVIKKLVGYGVRMSGTPNLEKLDIQAVEIYRDICKSLRNPLST